MTSSHRHNHWRLRLLCRVMWAVAGQLGYYCNPLDLIQRRLMMCFVDAVAAVVAVGVGVVAVVVGDVGPVDYSRSLHLQDLLMTEEIFSKDGILSPRPRLQAGAEISW